MAPTVHTHPLPTGYVYQEFPKVRHHAIHGVSKQLHNPDEEEKHTPDEEGWVDDLQELASRGVISSDTSIEEKPRTKGRGRIAVATD